MLRSTVALSLTLFVAIPTARAQKGASGCNREATTSFEFGHTAGNLMPAALEIGVDGTVRRVTDHEKGPVLGRVSHDSVRLLSRRAWRGGFAALPPAPTHPTGNPDMARPYIELHSACGMHHVEYAPGTESRLFRELYARLNRLTAPMQRRAR